MRMKPITKKVLIAVAEKIGLSDYTRITGSYKDQLTSKARWVSMFVLRKCGFSYPAIGKELNKNHATVINACKQVAIHKDLSLVAESFDELVSSYRLDSFRSPDTQRMIKEANGKWNKVFCQYKAECQICQVEDIVEVHHIRPLRNGGSNEPENLLILCSTHHRMLHFGLLKINKIGPPKLLIEEKI